MTEEETSEEVKEKPKTKPLAEWIKYSFGIPLIRTAQIIKSRTYGIKVNNVEIGNPNVKIKNGDLVTIDKNIYKVKFKEDEGPRKVVQKRGRRNRKPRR